MRTTLSRGTDGKNTEGAGVLILATGRWISTARLAMALAELGCVVDLVSGANHPALITDAVRTSYRYDPLRPARSLRSAIAQAKPVALIAADEVMVQHLEDLWWTAETYKTAESLALQRLIERSLGGRVTLNAARSRMALLEAAGRNGVAAPATLAVERPEQLAAAVEALGLPLVLKADATSGGRGVRMVEDMAGAASAWKALHEPPSLPRAMARGLKHKEWNHMRQSARGRTQEVTAQRFVTGRERTGMAVCRDGKVSACVSLEVVRTWCVLGPSSVLRVVQDEAMETAMRRIAGELGISGFCGFDFIVEEGTARSLLIEMNPRPTQLVHLPLGAGRDLVAAYARGVLGMNGVADREAATHSDLIALFPQELQRDAASEFLKTAYHDVPRNAPRLVERALAGSPQSILRERRRSGEASASLLMSEHRTTA